MLQTSGRGQKSPGRVFRIEPDFNRVALRFEVSLRKGQCLATGDPQLQLHQIKAGDQFGHRMLDLQPGVHLHEIERAICIQQKFHRTRPDIANGLCRCHRCRPDFVPQGLIDTGGRGFFNHLLMAPLNRAVTLKDMNAIAMPVGKNLYFNMPRAFQQAFDQHLLITKR